MKASIFMFATDLVDEGFEQVLDNVQQRGRLHGVTLACTYHHSRDVFPHNPVRKVRFFEGHLFFRPEYRRYAELRIKPLVSPLAEAGDPLATLIAHAERRGLAVRAWANTMHNTNLGSRHLDCAVHNAFGDPYITCLCPANPDVRAYVRTLTADLARYAVESIVLESASFMPFDHGYHHERTLLPLSPLTKFLLSLCFCVYCTQTAKAAGVDSEGVRHVLRTELERALNGEASAVDGLALDHKSIGTLLGGELAGYLEARQATVTTLIMDIERAVRQVRNVPVVFMDMSGGLRGVASGITVQGTEATALERSWQDGIDLPALLSNCDGLAVLGYTADPAQLAADIEAYRQLIPPGKSLSVALRPMLPDCDGPEQLATKLDVARRFAPDWVDFYHYGFMRLESLDWIGQAL